MSSKSMEIEQAVLVKYSTGQKAPWNSVSGQPFVAPHKPLLQLFPVGARSCSGSVLLGWGATC